MKCFIFIFNHIPNRWCSWWQIRRGSWILLILHLFPRSSWVLIVLPSWFPSHIDRQADPPLFPSLSTVHQIEREKISRYRQISTRSNGSDSPSNQQWDTWDLRLDQQVKGSSRRIQWMLDDQRSSIPQTWKTWLIDLSCEQHPKRFHMQPIEMEKDASVRCCGTSRIEEVKVDSVTWVLQCRGYVEDMLVSEVRLNQRSWLEERYGLAS